MVGSGKLCTSTSDCTWCPEAFGRIRAWRCGSGAFCHSLPDWVIVAVDAPLRHFLLFDVRAEGGRRGPAVLWLEFSIGRIGSLRHAEHHDDRAVAEGLFDGDRVVGNHAEIFGPAGPHLFPAVDHVSERVDEPVFVCHQLRERIYILPVDGAYKRVSNRFRQIVHVVSLLKQLAATRPPSGSWALARHAFHLCARWLRWARLIPSAGPRADRPTGN